MASSAATPVVYMTTAITPAALIGAYEALGRRLEGRVAVKISMGEPGPRGGNWLAPALIADLVARLDGAIVDANTGYGGQRSDTAKHRAVAEAHGFTAIAPVDILDADGEIDLPVAEGRRLDRDIVGSHLADYDAMLVLSHFKGHGMGGFGGAVKNMSIGIASSAGKRYIHSAGTSTTDFTGDGTHDGFLEAMAEAAKAVADRFGDRLAYVSVLNKLSVDCDCDGNAAPPSMADLGILASLDPVALDQASVDLVYAAPDGAELIERMESLNALHTLEHAVTVGLGSRTYNLVSLD
jgi:uncharacterized Fe-S center protein